MKFLALFYQNPAGYMASVLLLVFSAVSFALDNNTAFIFLISAIFILAVNILYSALSFKAVKKYIKLVNKSLAQEQINVVDDFPLPCILCDKKGNIVWYNKRFNENVLAENKKVSVNDFFSNFKYENFLDLMTTDVEFNNRKYSVFIKDSF